MNRTLLPVLLLPASLVAQAPPVAAPRVVTPPGYLNAMEPGSPAVEFYEDLKIEWSKRENEPPGLVAVWVKASDLDAWYQGGPHPLNTQYFYVSFLPSRDTAREMAGLQRNIEASADRVAVDPVTVARKFKLGQMHQYGVLRQWGGAFLFGNIAKADSLPRGVELARLWLTAAVALPGGGCFIHDLSLIQNETQLHQAVDRLAEQAERVAAANGVKLQP